MKLNCANPQWQVTRTPAGVEENGPTIAPIRAGEIHKPDDVVDSDAPILDDDGSHIWDINAFAADLQLSGEWSPNTPRAYTLDILTWLRFLRDIEGQSCGE